MGQNANKAPVFVCKHLFLLHEFAALIADPEIAEKAGYNIENCIEALEKPSEDKPDTARDYADLIRENNLDASFKEGARVVKVFLVFCAEYATKTDPERVDCWMVTEKEGKELRYIKGIGDEMSDITTFFTIQTGNGTLYGTKGLGRMLVNLHIAIDRSRNMALDSTFISQLCLVSTTQGRMNNVEFRIAHPFIFFDDAAATIHPNAFNFNYAQFQTQDASLNEIAESIAGAFVPNSVMQGVTPHTREEGLAKVQRESEVKAGVIGRWAAQCMEMISTIQKKICSETNIKEACRLFVAQKKERETNGQSGVAKGIITLSKSNIDLIKKTAKMFPEQDQENIDLDSLVTRKENAMGDTEAIQSIIEMLESGLTVMDIVLLSNAPAAELTQDMSAGQDAGTIQFIAANQQSPYLNKFEATKVAAEIAMGEQRAKQLLINVKTDPTVEVLESRQQSTEFTNIMNGEVMQVALTDNHAIHRKTLAPKIQQLVGLCQRAPTLPIINAAEMGIKHFADHIMADIKCGVSKQMLKADILFAKSVDKEMMKIKKAITEAVKQGHNVEALGLPQPGQPPVTAGGKHGGILGDDSSHKMAQIQLEHEKLKLSQRKQDHEEHMDAAKIALETAKHGMDLQNMIENHSSPDLPDVTEE